MDRQAGWWADRQGGGQAGRVVDRQAGWWTDRQAGREECRKSSDHGPKGELPCDHHEPTKCQGPQINKAGRERQATKTAPPTLSAHTDAVYHQEILFKQ